MPGKKIIILTGEVQTGKTTLLQQWASCRNDVAGILSPVRNGERFFYFLQQDRFIKMEANPQEKEQLLVGRFVFSATAFQEAESNLINLLEHIIAGYLVIDEIGPLEMVQKKGLYKAFLKAIEPANGGTIILVVRAAMVQQVLLLVQENGIDCQVVGIENFIQLVES
jgi:nucleoside-triphosphatase THEP1